MASKIWRIEKYGRFKKVNIDAISTDNNKSGEWEILASLPNKPILLSVVPPLNLVLKFGADVLESFTLLESSKWLRVISKSDSMLFLYKLKNDVRRFRIKFLKDEIKTAEEQCNDFVSAISLHVCVQNASDPSICQSSLLNYDANKPDSSASRRTARENIRVETVANVARSMITGKPDLPSYYETTNLKVDDDKSASFIKTLLLDPNFPTFVESVEKLLNEMTK